MWQIRQRMSFVFTGLTAWPFFVTEIYFWGEIIIILIVRCRALRKWWLCRHWVSTACCCSASFSRSHFCPLVELGGGSWEEQAQTCWTTKRLLLSMPKCEMLARNEAQIKQILCNASFRKIKLKPVSQVSFYLKFYFENKSTWVALLSTIFCANKCYK